MLMNFTSSIILNWQYFAPQTKVLPTTFTLLWTFFFLQAQRASMNFMDAVNLTQRLATTAASIDIRYQSSRLGWVKTLRKIVETTLTNSKVTAGIIVDSIIAHRGANSTHIANIVQICNFLKSISMSNWTIFFRTRRYSARNTVKLVANSTNWPA